MFPFQQQIAGDNSRSQADAFQYYQRQQQDRQYTQTPQAPQQAPQQTQPGQQYYAQSQYPPYFYQVPQVPLSTAATDGSQASNPQDRYQASVYRYGNSYAAPAAPGATTSAGAAGATAPTAPGSRTAAYPTYPYNDNVLLMYPHQQQQAQLQQQQHPAQASPQQSSYPGNQLGSPHVAGQRSLYTPGQAAPAVPGQYRGMQPPQAGQPQLAPMPMGQGRTVAPAVPPAGHRATVSTHLSAIPVTMPVTDPTGQTAPPGIKPRVTTTLWEDEGTTCFQVEARGFCVARREDNDMINGTKLLNVAGMTRGRRDGLLKGERNRHVVKAGAMHLKGVWIPYDRALDFANKERIVDLLYPLFVTDIKSVLYQPGSQDMRHGVPNPGAAPTANAATPQHAQVSHAQGHAQVQPPQHAQALPQQHAQVHAHAQAHPQAQAHTQPQPVVAPQQQHQMPHLQGAQTGSAPAGATSQTPTGPGPNGAATPVANGPGVPGPVPGTVPTSGTAAAPSGGAGTPGQNGAPGPVGVVPGAVGVTGAPQHLPVVQQQIEGQQSEPGTEQQSGSAQLPQLEGLANVQPGIENHQQMPQSQYGLPQKPKSELEETSGQPRHYEPEKGQYYGYDSTQAAQPADGAQQQGYY